MIFVSAVIMAGAWIFAQIIDRAIRRGARYARIRPEVINSVTRGITVLALLVGLFGVLTYVGLTSVVTLITGLGIVGLAISLALQATLSNIIAGISLLMDRTIRLDDVIELSGIKGKVVKIGMRSTWIKTENGDLVIIPNSTMTTTPLKNHSLSARLYRGAENDVKVESPA
jgi:small-conductance mechanosensitive channel